MFRMRILRRDFVNYRPFMDQVWQILAAPVRETKDGQSAAPYRFGLLLFQQWIPSNWPMIPMRHTIVPHRLLSLKEYINSP